MPRMNLPGEYLVPSQKLQLAQALMAGTNAPLAPGAIGLSRLASGLMGGYIGGQGQKELKEAIEKARKRQEMEDRALTDAYLGMGKAPGKKSGPIPMPRKKNGEPLAFWQFADANDEPGRGWENMPGELTGDVAPDPGGTILESNVSMAPEPPGRQVGMPQPSHDLMLPQSDVSATKLMPASNDGIVPTTQWDKMEWAMRNSDNPFAKRKLAEILLTRQMPDYKFAPNGTVVDMRDLTPGDNYGKDPSLFSKPDPSKYTSESVAKAIKSGDYADLVLRDEGDGPFEGNAMDAQVYNILLKGDPNSPEYAAAYNHAAQEKIKTDEHGGVYRVQPDMSAFRKPTRMSGGELGGGRAKVEIDGVRKRPKPYADAQAQAGNFAMRMVDSAKTLGSVIAGPDGSMGTKDDVDPYTWDQFALSGIPGVGNFFVSEDFQKAKQAQDNWISANLRKESGAAIPVEELENERKKWFPVPGDGEEVIRQKYEARKIATENMIKQSQGAYEELFENRTPGSKQQGAKPEAQEYFYDPATKQVVPDRRGR